MPRKSKAQKLTMPRKSKAQKLKQAQAANTRRIYHQQKAVLAQARQGLRQDTDCSEGEEKSHETVLITDRKLENYLDDNYVCDCLYDSTVRHTVKISDQCDNIQVTKSCSHCKLTVTRALMGNHENLVVRPSFSGLERCEDDTQNSATKRFKTNSEREEINYKITSRETVLMLTYNQLEKYLDNNYLCCYCLHFTLRHTVKVDQHDVQVTESCSHCNNTASRAMMEDHKILKALVYCNMQNGHGYMFYKSMCAINRIDYVSPLVYSRCQNHIRYAVNKKWQVVQENTCRIIFAQYKEQLHRDPIDGFLNIDVCFDGSRSHHHSHIGTAFVVDMITGLVVDLNVFCKNCMQCPVFQRRKQTGKINQAQFDREMAEHLPHCNKNYRSSVKNMEGDAAVLIWGRSQNIKLKYTTFVDNGDSSSAYNKVCGMNHGAGPYGDVKVEKTECINYFIKRLTKQLYNVNESKEKAEGNGKLNFEAFWKLITIFKEAIRTNNTDWRKMRDACLSGVFHETSTDENPMHRLCPEGKDSWCFYQQDIANEKIPRLHKTMNIYIPLSNKGKAEVTKIYYNLVSEENMKKCLKGKTPNESLHNRVWNRVPKDRFVGRSMVEFSMAVTAINHNTGRNLMPVDIPDIADCYLNMVRVMRKPPRRRQFYN